MLKSLKETECKILLKRNKTENFFLCKLIESSGYLIYLFTYSVDLLSKFKKKVDFIYYSNWLKMYIFYQSRREKIS